MLEDYRNLVPLGKEPVLLIPNLPIASIPRFDILHNLQCISLDLQA